MSSLDPESYLSTARSHAAQHPLDAELALERVRAEIDEDGDADDIRCIAADMAQAVTRPGLSAGDQGAVVDLWLEWAAFENASAGAEATEGAWKRLLAASVRAAGVPDLHPRLLAAFFEAELSRGADARATLDKIVKGYHPTPAFFEPAFDVLTAVDEADVKSNGKGEDNAAHLYRAWRGACRSDADRVAAALTYAHWLLEEGRGRDAHTAVETARREVEDAAELDEGWTQLVDAAERARLGEVSDDEDEDMESEGEGEDEGEQSAGEQGEQEGEDEDEEMVDTAESDGSGDLEMTL